MVALISKITLPLADISSKSSRANLNQNRIPTDRTESEIRQFYLMKLVFESKRKSCQEVRAVFGHIPSRNLEG